MRAFPNPPKPGHRALALILALCALVLLLIGTVTTTQAFVTKVGETTLVDFASGQFYRTSLLEIPPDIDSVQLVPVGLSGQWGIEPHSLPIGLTELAAVAGRNAAANKGQIVIMGGFDAGFQYHDEVFVSTVNTDGSLGPWIEQTGAPLPQPRAGAAAAIYPRDANSSWIYLLGGTSGGDSEDSVYYTVLDHNTGSISPWIINTYPLSMPVYYEDVAVHNGYIYVVGGYWLEPPLLPEAVTSVYYAQIQPDGSLGQWQDAAALPEPLSTLLVVAYSEGSVNTLYAIGGWDRTGGPSHSSYRVYFADIHPDGSLSSWQLSSGSLPAQIYAHSGVQINGQILVTGGRDATNTISDTVKAALIDPTNPNFRLYDWCLGIPPPTCTIGAWQSGPILPEPRAFHVTVQDRGYVYTLGGVGANGQPTNVVYWGSVNGLGAMYAPWGHYTSSEFDFGGPTILHKVEWGTTIAFPSDMSLKFRYRYKPQGQDWQPWSAQTNSVDGLNVLSFDPPVDNVRQFQYRVDMTTNLNDSSPLLDWIDIYYEVDDPEVSVRKDTGSVITVSLGTVLDYTIYFTNSGGWMAENVVLTETLPTNTSYAGGPEWQQVGNSAIYTYAVGNLGPRVNGAALFRVRVDDEVPPGTTRITNTVEIGYPPMIDALGQTIVDPQPANNHAVFSNPLIRHHMAADKEAIPISGSVVEPGTVITYTLDYHSDGSAAVSGIVLTDALPAGVTYVPGSIWPAMQGNDSDPRELRWSVGNLASGMSASAGFRATVDNNVSDETRITNTFTVDSLETKPVESPPVVHIVHVPAASFVITKTAAPPDGSIVQFGQRITYTLSYFNHSDDAATGVTMVDELPPEVTYVPGSIWPAGQGDDSDPGNLEWTIGAVPAGSGGNAGFAVTVNEDAGTGITITNRFTLSSDQSPIQSSPPVTHVIPPPNLVLTKSATPSDGSLVESGQRIDYTLSWHNNGGLLLTGLSLTDILPPYVTYVPGSIWPAGQGDDSDPDELAWDVGDLAPGGNGTAGFAVTVDNVPGGLAIENSFQADSLQTDPQQSNKVKLITHRLAPDFVVTKIEPVPSDPAPGESFNLFVTVKNVGSRDADAGDFWVEVYLRPRPSTAPAGPSDHSFGMCSNQPCSPPYRYEYVEGLTSLGAGASFPLQFSGLVLPGSGHYDVWAQADISFDGDDPRWGRYLEEKESNNMNRIILGGGILYLTQIWKSY
jgi:uncharacterized repeat protein (TIGR01451 family)